MGASFWLMRVYNHQNCSLLRGSNVKFPRSLPQGRKSLKRMNSYFCPIFFEGIGIDDLRGDACHVLAYTKV